MIKHDWDTDYLLMILDEYKNKFNEIYDFLLERSIVNSKQIMSVVNETNRYCFGKVHLRLNTLTFFPSQGAIFIKISLPPFTIESKRVRGMDPDKEKVE